MWGWTGYLWRGPAAGDIYKADSRVSRLFRGSVAVYLRSFSEGLFYI